jgi:hypothetical protein
MSREAHRSSSGSLTVFAGSGLYTRVVTGRSQVWVGTGLSQFPLRLYYGRSPHTYVNQRLQIQLELLMMSGVPLETCWAFNERWNNKFYYKVASCWLFLLSQTTMHGSMNIKGRTPLKEWSATAYTTKTRDEYPCPHWDSNPEIPATERLPSCALDHTATEIGKYLLRINSNNLAPIPILTITHANNYSERKWCNVCIWNGAEWCREESWNSKFKRLVARVLTSLPCHESER